MPQLDNLDVDVSVEVNLAVFARLYRVPDVREAVDRALALSRLEARRRDAVDELSGGMRRRLLLARGLLHLPRLLLLDEPTVGLDPQIRTEMWTLIDGLRSEGTTILMSTHYIEEAERLADEVALMVAGKVIARGRPAELIATHAGRQTAEVYGPPDRLREVRAGAVAAGLPVRPAGPAIAIVGAERAVDGALPGDAIRRAATPPCAVCGYAPTSDIALKVGGEPSDRGSTGLPGAASEPPRPTGNGGPGRSYASRGLATAGLFVFLSRWPSARVQRSAHSR